ncbi:helix-turn-helix domain-containing protein [Paenibacillus radicis (ex Gao et al. 2016)]|uniref:HTH araC/xylS-type domain-containing protein n=1 Tax=Paenibacillus radicis (ex Gao et al. 2016) TaxID=1737354 RepID=A0A917GUZ0_9BACL|nr:helix-turn-helix domain-containing protein [Paenibacillus radicis (ex Gao et al. 2016)]GGG58015.1 hypothetical protein GCM10010918_08860 [Paenibacillus radicis (ex Gao et al. 2016)]
MNQVINKHVWFIRLLVPYMLFLFLALTLGWLIYNNTLDLLDNEARRNNLHMLEQVKTTLDGRFTEIDTIVKKAANDPKLLRFQQVKEPFEGTNTYKLLATQKDLYNFSIFNKFIVNYMIYYRNSDIVISPSQLYQADQFYKQVLNYDDMSYEQWHQLFFEGENSKRFLPAADALYLHKSKSIITYSYPLGLIPSLSQGSIVVLIDNNEILKLLSGLDIKDGGWAYIADDKGNIISSTGEYNKLDLSMFSQNKGFITESQQTGQKMITYVHSSANGWYYVLAQSPHVVLEKVNYVKRITFGFTLAFLVIGVVVAYFFTSRNSRKVSHVLNNNQALQEEIEKQAPLLRATFFERLLKGELVSGHEMEAMLKRQHLSAQISSSAVVIVQFSPANHYEEGDQLKELDRQRVIIKETLRANNQFPIHYHDVAEDKIALLFLETDIDSDACKQKIRFVAKELTDAMLQQFQITLNIAAGGVYESLLDLSRSYGEAKHALHFSLRLQQQGIVWFSELPQQSDVHYYPGELETRLMNHAKNGDVDEVNLLLNDIYERNFVQRNLSPSIQRLLIYDMASSLLKLNDQLSLENETDILSLLGKADNSDDLAAVFRFSQRLYGDICEWMLERKMRSNVKLLENILHYLHTMYRNADLNLDTVADQAGISKVYLSQLFKEKTGSNFSDYLESLRMEQSRKLLSDTTLSVNEIAVQTGYNSTNSFCRAFKRINGISPTAYRNFTL